MTLLGGLTRSLEDGTRPLTDASLAEWLSGPKSDAGVSVSEARVMGLPAYYRALSLTAGTLASLPLKVYKQGTRDRVARTTVIDQPNPRQTSIEYRTTTFLNLFAWGNAFSRKVRDGSGLVREVWPLHPSNVRVEYVDPSPANPAGKEFIVTVKGQEIRLSGQDVLHLPYMSIDGMSGVRPMDSFRQSLGIAIAGDDSTARFIANGSRLSGILSTDSRIDDSVATKLKKRWREATSGVANTGEIAVLGSGAKFQPISIPPADAQMLQGRQWAVAEIGRMLGTPPHLIGDVSNSTSWGTGIEQQVLNWVKFTLQLPITTSEQRWTQELLPAGEFCEHSLEGLLRGDAASRALFHHYAITDGWKNRAEVRDTENLPTGPDNLDEFIVPSNMTLVSVDGELVPLSSAGVADPTSTTAG